MDRIRVGEQEADGDGFNAAGDELCNGGANVLRHQWLDDLASRIHPLANFENAIAREQHFRGGREDVEDVLAAPLSSDLVDIAEPARGQQPHPHALAFQQGVERRGRAVQDERDGIGTEIARQVGGDAFHHRGWLRRVGEIFANGYELAPIFVKCGDVGESAADVDADAQVHR